VTDYTALDASGVLRACGDNGSKWAAAFKQHAEKLGHHGMDEGWLIGWFFNAIEGACDTRRWRAEAEETAPWQASPILPR
jgi:hypothetical protein